MRSPRNSTRSAGLKSPALPGHVGVFPSFPVASPVTAIAAERASMGAAGMLGRERNPPAPRARRHGKPGACLGRYGPIPSDCSDWHALCSTRTERYQGFGKIRRDEQASRASPVGRSRTPSTRMVRGGGGDRVGFSLYLEDQEGEPPRMPEADRKARIFRHFASVSNGIRTCRRC